MDIVEHPPVSPVRSVSNLFAGRMKFLVGGALIVAAIVYLIWTSATANAQYFMTVDEVRAQGAALGSQELRVSGAVIGDSIKYDSKALKLEFTVANTPGSQKEVDAQGGLAAVLHAAVTNPNASRLEIVYTGVKPDLMRNEAQAIMTGKMGSDGKFYATELLLKCPTKYEAAVPNQVQGK